MSAVTLNHAGVDSLLNRTTDLHSLDLDGWVAPSRVSQRDAELMRLPAGTINDVEYKPSADEASDRGLFEAFVSRIYGADKKPTLRAQLLSSPDAQHLSDRNPLARAFDVRLSGASARRGSLG